MDRLGFPPNGSLSVAKLRMLKLDLEQEEKKLKGKKTIKTEVLEQIEDNKACFNVWMKEADNRERKQLQKQTTLLNMGGTKRLEDVCIFSGG